MPGSGLLVCNHLSYLDIIVLSSIRPFLFVATLAGARAAATIFVDRQSKLDAVRTVDRIREAVDAPSLVVLFPEGPSSDGSTVLPFKSSLLESAVQLDCSINVAAIDYTLEHGSVADEVCYWRDMTLVPHLLNLFTKPNIHASVSFASVNVRGLNRKEMADRLRSDVVTLRF